jgi:hypothetical protein
MDDADRRYALINLPHARTIASRIERTLDALGAFSEGGNGDASPLRTACARLERALERYDEDPPQDEALEAADRAADVGRALAGAIEASRFRSDRLGQHVRNLFECLALAEEGAELSLRCGERPDSPLR